MDDAALLRLLQDALSRLDVEVRSETMPEEAVIRGGLCRVRGRSEVFLSPRASTAERVAVMLDALGKLDTDGLWLPPIVRERLGGRR